MAFRMSTALKNFLCDQGMVCQLAGTYGTAGTAKLWIYSGTQSTSADLGSAGSASTCGVLLCTISNIAWAQATGGTSWFSNGTASTAGYYGTAATTGTATWARIENVNAQGTCRIEGDVGTSGANVFTINSVAINANDVIHLISAAVYMA